MFVVSNIRELKIGMYQHTCSTSPVVVALHVGILDMAATSQD
jgi:hypothetical protein